MQISSLRCRVLVCNAADTASLATWILFGKLIGVATFVGFGKKRCRKNLPLCDLTALTMSMHIKLSPKLFDLFQHCELRCNAGCCGWDAFDLSERWLTRWCEFRDSHTISAARDDIARIRELLDGLDSDTTIHIEQFFDPVASTVLEHLELIDKVLASCSPIDA